MSHAARRGLPLDTDPSAVAGLVSLLTLGTAFGVLALGVPWFWVVLPVGFGGVLPVAVAAAKRQREGRTARDRRAPGGRDSGHRERSDRVTDAALARLRQRYAAGELDEAAFEERLERLLLTDDAESAREHARRRREERSDRPADERLSRGRD